MDSRELSHRLDAHGQWLDSNGTQGDRFDIQGASLSGMNLRGVRLIRASLRGADLFNADLSHADLRGAVLCKSDLRQANLRGALLNYTSLRGAQFKLANLTMSDMRDADLLGTDLRSACLHSTRLPEYTWVISGESYSLQITNGALLRAGCAEHPVWDWRAFSYEQIESMDGARALLFYPRLLDILDCYLGKGIRPAWVSTLDPHLTDTSQPHKLSGNIHYENDVHHRWT